MQTVLSVSCVCFLFSLILYWVRVHPYPVLKQHHHAAASITKIMNFMMERAGGVNICELSVITGTLHCVKLRQILASRSWSRSEFLIGERWVQLMY